MSFAYARRDVWIVAACTGISYAGDFLAETALTLTLQERGASGTEIAALLLALMVPMVVLAPVAGRIADRYSSRVLLPLIGSAQAVVCVALAYVTGPAAAIGLMALLATGLAVTGPTLSALVPQMVDRERLPRAQATIQTVRGVGILLGPALAGLLVGRYGQAVPLLVDAASFLAVVAAGLFLRTVRRGGSLRDAGTGRVRGGFDLVRSDPLLVAALVLISAGIAAVSCDNVGMVFLVRDTLHGSATAYGLLGALWSVAAIVGGWLLGRRTPGDRGLVTLLVAVVAVFGLTMLGLAAARSVGWLVPTYVIGGLANGGLNLVIGVLLGRRVPAGARGRVGAIFGGVVNAGTIIGYAGGGLLLSVVGPRTLFAGSGLVALGVVAALCVPVLRMARRATTADPVAAATITAAHPHTAATGAAAHAADPAGADRAGIGSGVDGPGVAPAAS
ncbi:MFS transporter [Actinocatenispora rupis]|uniref:Major facilitator superfamily (MFS) profile domain-containing protein n=1 Tax=Actinocatenispora rupis TaxID=519421 RepID=A0A8J3J0P5_9ACTN|nr:MFS transporter [Actinocatenispora rupis]GID09880.1 hypothetical protein Aru02nite_07690 [Actinocatenispora rupis]